MGQGEIELNISNISLRLCGRYPPNKVLQLTRYSALFQSADIFTLPKRAVTSS